MNDKIENRCTLFPLNNIDIGIILDIIYSI